MLTGFLLALAAIAAPGTLSEPLAQTPLTVSAAASLTDVLDQIAAAYAEAGGGPIRFNVAGSNVLARQIVNGAPVDLFISADAAQMDVAARAGAILEDTRIDLLQNRLAVVARPDLQLSEVKGLLDAGVRRVALGDPAAVPAGVYARRYLEACGVWQEIASRVVPVGNVRAALAAVDNGSADAAIVYATDAPLARRARVAFVAPSPPAPAISYPAAVVARTRDREAARRFLAFLQGPEAAAVFREHGFVVPDPRPEP